MASFKLMASSSDLNRKLSSCASTDFLKLDSSSSNAGDNFASDSAMVDGFPRNGYLDRDSGPDRGHRPGLETESSSSTRLNTEMTSLDAAGAITPIRKGGFEPGRVGRKTVDDVWREIVAGKKIEKQQPKEEMMTLEDFLVKTGAVEAEAEAASGGLLEVKEEGMSGGLYHCDSKSEVGVVGSMVRGKWGGKRSLSLMEPLDKAAQQRQRRMIKNRESAARSREHKQAYQVELESMVARLEEENEQLLKEKVQGVYSPTASKSFTSTQKEQTKKRLKQLMENVIPVVELKRPPLLRRVRSI